MRSRQVLLRAAPRELLVDDRVETIERLPDRARRALDARTAQREQHHPPAAASAPAARRSRCAAASMRSASTPNTARRITSSVIARVRSCRRIGRPSGQPPCPCASPRTITSSYSRMRSPWNGGSSSLRWRMCSGPVSTITELGPITGAIGELPAADGATSGGAVKTVLTASGSLTTTSCIPLGQNVSVNVSPSARAQRSITQVGASAHASVCASAGIRGPGGRPARTGAPAALGALESGAACGPSTSRARAPAAASAAAALARLRPYLQATALALVAGTRARGGAGGGETRWSDVQRLCAE